VSTAERDALVALYNSTNGSAWADNTNWDTANPVSTWFGVTVVSNSVTRIELPSNNLTGSLPADLLNLTNLTFLKLDNNSLESDLPDFTAFTSLTELYFDNNNFQYGDFENEHAAYTGLSVYSNNPQANVDDIETIGAVLGSNVTLSTNCSGTQNNYQWHKGVYPAGTLLAGETNADLNLNAIVAADAGEYYCVITSDIVTDLTLVREQITLTVGTCDDIGRDALIALYNATDGPNWVNNANWNTTASIDTWFGVTTNASGCVTSIDLNASNNFAGANNLTGTLPEELGNLESLEVLDLFNGNLTGTIPTSLTRLTNLKNLNLGSHDLTGPIPEDIGNLSQLQYLNFSSNELTGNIPESITLLSNLLTLNVAGNELSGDVPFDVTNMLSLRILYLYENELTGTIYPEYSNLLNLTQLLLDDNLFTSIIPPELGSLSNLIDLRIGNSGITGTLPVEIGNLTNLNTLLIRNTEITGGIPAEYGNLPNLRGLFLSNNELTSIAPELSNLTTLLYVFINGNQITGSLSDFTSNPNFSIFHFYSNQFEFGDFENQFNWYETNLTNLNYSPQANVDVEETLTVCENEMVILTTTVSGTQNTYEWYKGVYPSGTLIAGETNADLVLNATQATDAGNYYSLIDSDIVTGLTLVRNPLHLVVNASGITANPVSDLSVCDDNNDGYADFTIDISDIEAQVIGSQTGLTVSYFDELGDPLTLTDPFTNTTQYTQTITVRVFNTSNCYEETTFDLIVNPIPSVDTISNQTECDSYTLPMLTNGSYCTQPNGAGTLLNTGDLITSTQTIYIYNQSSGCSAESNFLVTINETPMVDSLTDQTACDIYTLPSLTNGNYYTGSNGTGSMLNSGDSITVSQTIYIYNQSGTAPNTCSDESSFTVRVNQTPLVDAQSDQTSCDSYTLEPLTNGNYYTQANGNGTMLNAGDVLTTTQTIYVYNEVDTCSAESSFLVTINVTPVVDVFNDEAVCDSYTLPVLTNGNYYTQPDGNGTMLSEGDQITATQTIYVYANNNGCTGQSSFNITVNASPVVDVLSDVFDCDSYTLEVLSSGDYFTEPNGNGTPLFAGAIITTSQTIYIFEEMNGCFDESSFEITILATADFVLNEGNLEINEGELTVTMTDASINYEYAITGYNYQNSNVFSGLTDGNYTLYVRDENGCIEKTIDFIIELTQFSVPKYFTPNGDNVHETWDVVDNKNSIQSVYVFNRYGKLLFQSQFNEVSWDGTYKNQQLPSNDYWYQIVLKNGFVVKGHFSLKR
jgi:gliding motility-associated-like protein